MGLQIVGHDLPAEQQHVPFMPSLMRIITMQNMFWHMLSMQLLGRLHDFYLSLSNVLYHIYLPYVESSLHARDKFYLLILCKSF